MSGADQDQTNDGRPHRSKKYLPLAQKDQPLAEARKDDGGAPRPVNIAA